MEQLNKVELRGIIGISHTEKVQDKMKATFMVATDYLYKNAAGEVVVETTWHNVIAWEGGRISAETIQKIEKGAGVHICGRLKNSRYYGIDGKEKCITETIANTLEVL